MDRLKNIFHRRAKGIPANDSDASSQGTAIPTSPKLLSPSPHWTKHQLFYVIVMQGLGAFIISGGIEFAIAYGEFYTLACLAFAPRDLSIYTVVDIG